MKKPECSKDCPFRNIWCHTDCETYKEIQEYNKGVTAYLREGKEADSTLIQGYVSRAAKIHKRNRKSFGKRGSNE